MIACLQLNLRNHPYFIQDTLPSLLDQFRPGFVLYDAGVDVHEKDDLGRLSLSDAGLMQRDEFVLSQCVGKLLQKNIITEMGEVCKRAVFHLASKVELKRRP